MRNPRQNAVEADADAISVTEHDETGRPTRTVRLAWARVTRIAERPGAVLIDSTDTDLTIPLQALGATAQARVDRFRTWWQAALRGHAPA